MDRSRTRTIAPDEDCFARGAKFSCHIDHRRAHQHSGVVYGECGDVRWLYGVRKNRLGRNWQNPFDKKEFVVASPQTGEEIVIRRVSFFPSRFTIIDAQVQEGRCAW